MNFRTWSSLSCLDVFIHVFHQIWGDFNHCFFKYSLCPFLCFFSFWNSHDACIGPLDYVPQVLSLCSLFFNIFSFCSSDLIVLLSYLQIHCFFFLPTQVCLWLPLVNFSFQLFLLYSTHGFKSFLQSSIQFIRLGRFSWARFANNLHNFLSHPIG